MAERAVYYMCKYTPVELFAGFDVPCLRLEPDTDQFQMAESLGHPNMCGYGKGLLEAVLQRGIRELVLVNCCDVVRRLYDILRAEGSLDFLYLIDLPHHTGDAEAVLFAKQLRALAKAYADYSHKEWDARSFLEAWSGSNGCSFCGDRQTEAQKQNSPALVRQEQGVFLSLQGAHSGAFLSEMIARHSALPVQDDTCVGNRKVSWPAGGIAWEEGEEETGRLWGPYAKALLRQLPCMRMTDIQPRAALGAGAAGIVYHTMKFCDYYGFEYAERPEQRKTPLLKIETDGTRQSEGQLATRLDAFAEGLHGKTREKRNMQEGYYAVGIDSGSTSTDVAVLDPDKELVGWAVAPTGAGAAAGAQKALQEALAMAGITEAQVGRIVTTGYGRAGLGLGDDSITEITCHAQGAHFLDPSVRTVIDIGGQDSKIIRLDERGAVTNFVMNDKCAAGTGRFLEMMARTMEMDLEEMSERGTVWKEEIPISSMCTVFAESEVVSLIAENKETADIIHGLNESVATRTYALLRRLGEEGAYMMTGGVAKNRGVVAVLEKKLGEKIHISEHAQLCGAIGAALLAQD